MTKEGMVCPDCGQVHDSADGLIKELAFSARCQIGEGPGELELEARYEAKTYLDRFTICANMAAAMHVVLARGAAFLKFLREKKGLTQNQLDGLSPHVYELAMLGAMGEPPDFPRALIMTHEQLEELALRQQGEERFRRNPKGDA